MTPVQASCPQVAVRHEPWLLARPSHEWDLLQLWEKCLLWYSEMTFPWGTADLRSGINWTRLPESTFYSRTKLQCAGSDPIHVFCASRRAFNAILTDGVMSISIQKPREHLCLDLCQYSYFRVLFTSPEIKQSQFLGYIWRTATVYDQNFPEIFYHKHLSTKLGHIRAIPENIPMYFRTTTSLVRDTDLLSHEAVMQLGVWFPWPWAHCTLWEIL